MQRNKAASRLASKCKESSTAKLQGSRGAGLRDAHRRFSFENFSNRAESNTATATDAAINNQQ